MGNYKIRINAIFAFIETFVAAGTLFIIFRLIITNLGLPVLGVWSLVVASTSFARVADLGVSAGVTRFVAKSIANGEPETAAQIIETASITVFLIYTTAAILAIAPINLGLSHLLTGSDIALAQRLVPFALISLILNSTATSVLSAHAGLQESYKKSIINIVGNCIYLILSLLLTPLMGVIGVSAAQCIQAFMILAIGWLTLRKSTPTLPILPTRWSWSTLRPIIAYGGQLQLSSLAILLFDPATKMVLTFFGGPAAVGAYEIASRLVTQARSFIVTINQTLVAVFADAFEGQGTSAKQIFRRTFSINLLTCLGVLTGIVLAGNAALKLLVGPASQQAAAYLPIVSLGWLFNTTATPIYILGVGSGILRYNTASQLVIALINIPLAYMLGSILGPIGVIYGSMISLAAGTIIVYLGYFVEFQGRFKAMKGAANA